jgi:hypothetical protein
MTAVMLSKIEPLIRILKIRWRTILATRGHMHVLGGELYISQGSIFTAAP